MAKRFRKRKKVLAVLLSVTLIMYSTGAINIYGSDSGIAGMDIFSDDTQASNVSDGCAVESGEEVMDVWSAEEQEDVFLNNGTEDVEEQVPLVSDGEALMAGGKVDVQYINKDGVQKSTVAYEVNASDSYWNRSWYIAQGNVVIENSVTLRYDVNLILADGCSLTIKQGINVNGRNLYIYEQESGTGTLTAIGGKNRAGIGNMYYWDKSGSVTVYGGTIIANGGNGAAGIGSGLVSVNGNAVVIANPKINSTRNYTKGIIFEGTDAKTGYVYGNVILSSKSLQVPQDSTLTINKGSALTIDKGGSLTVEKNSELVNNGSISIGNTGKVIIAGLVKGEGTWDSQGTIETSQDAVIVDYSSEKISYNADIIEVSDNPEFTSLIINDSSISQYISNDNNTSLYYRIKNIPISIPVKELTLPARPTAPTAIIAKNESISGSRDGQINNTNSAMQYRVQDGQWIDVEDTTITGLMAGFYYVRYKAVNEGESPRFASQEQSLIIRVRDALNMTGPSFSEAVYGYEQPDPVSFTIVNTDIMDVRIDSVTVDNTDAFTISGAGDIVAAGSSVASWKIQPTAGLKTGTYNGVITVTYNKEENTEGTQVQCPVTFTVSKASQTAPAIPELQTKSYNSIVLKEIGKNSNGADAEYSNDGGITWQNSPVFTDLSASTEYMFVARYKSTENHDTSPNSPVKKITTDRMPYYYTICSEAGVGGRIIPSGNYSFRENTNVAYSIIPDEGCEIADILVDGKSIGTESNYTFSCIDGNHTISALFLKIVPKEYPEGTVAKPDGSFETKDGVIIKLDGAIVLTDGTEITEDSEGNKPTIDKDGKITCPDSSVRNGDGTYIKPAKVKVDFVETTGNRINVNLSGEAAGADGYDYVIGTSQDMLKTKNYYKVTKNLDDIQTLMLYVQKGTYYAACHAWTYNEEGKKVFGSWSEIERFEVTAVTPEPSRIISVRKSGRDITVTYTKCDNATGYDIILGTECKVVNGERRPVNQGVLVKKINNGDTVTVTFKNVKNGTYYVGLHAWNRSSVDKKKVFSPWSNVKKVTIAG